MRHRRVPIVGRGGFALLRGTVSEWETTVNHRATAVNGNPPAVHTVHTRTRPYRLALAYSG